MALKPTVYKFRIALSDLNRGLFTSLSLTVARHPSETAERMMVRVLAYCLNADDQLEFCKGLSDSDEPDLWHRSLDERVLCWIDVGEPQPERIRKARRRALSVKVYSFNSKAPTWWKQQGGELSGLDVSVYRFDHAQVTALAGRIERGMEFPLTISGDSLYLSLAGGDSELTVHTLQEAAD